MAAPQVIAGGGFNGRNGDGSYTPDAGRAALALPAVAPVIIPPLTYEVNGIQSLNIAFGHTITTEIGKVSVADQEASPTKPPDKAVSFSTYGVVIPRSIGRRRMSGNVLECSPIQSIMLGTYDYFVDYQIPITTTDEQFGGLVEVPDNNKSGDDTLQQEQSRQTTVTRVFQNNDPASDNWVDVEDPTSISFKNPSNLVRNFIFNS